MGREIRLRKKKNGGRLAPLHSVLMMKMISEQKIIREVTIHIEVGNAIQMRQEQFLQQMVVLTLKVDWYHPYFKRESRKSSDF